MSGGLLNAALVHLLAETSEQLETSGCVGVCVCVFSWALKPYGESLRARGMPTSHTHGGGLSKPFRPWCRLMLHLKRLPNRGPN